MAKASEINEIPAAAATRAGAGRPSSIWHAQERVETWERRRRFWARVLIVSGFPMAYLMLRFTEPTYLPEVRMTFAVWLTSVVALSASGALAWAAARAFERELAKAGGGRIRAMDSRSSSRRPTRRGGD